MTEGYHVLHVDDDPTFLSLIGDALSKESEPLTIESVESAPAALELLDEGVDCIVTDYDMPEMHGIELLESVRERDETFPVILLTAEGNERIASEAISAGATDYLRKRSVTGQFDLLADRIERAVENYRARQAVHQQREQLDSYRQLLEEGLQASNTYVWEWDIRSDAVDRYPPEEPLFGVSTTDIGGVFDGFIDRVHPSDQERVRREIEAGVESGTGYEFECRLRTTDDTYRWVRDRGDILTDDTGEAVRAIGSVTDITAATEREAALRERTAQLEGVLDTIDVAVWVRDANSRYLQMNRAYREEFDLMNEDVIGKTPVEVLGTEYGEQFMAVDERVLETGEGFETERVIDTPKGKQVTLVRLQPIYKGNEIAMICGVSTDITEKRRQAQAAQERAEQLELALDAGEIGTWEWNRKREHFTFDDRIYEMLGYERGTLEPSPDTWVELRHPDDADRVLSALDEHLRGDSEQFSVEQRIKDAEGEWRWLLDVGRVVDRDKDGEPERLIGCITDITDQKRREQELQTRTEELETVLDRFERTLSGTETIVWEFDEANKSLSLYGPVEQLLGTVPDEDSDSLALLARYVHPESRQTVERAFESLQTGSQNSIDIEYRVERDGGTARWQRTQALRRDANGESSSIIVGITTDITSRKEREERLDRFAGIISHDLRNPLTVVGGRLELAHQEAPESEHIDAALSAVDRMDTLIDDLLTWARHGQSPTELVPVSIREVATACWSNVPTKNATLNITGDGTVQADHGRLHQLFENLFRNAIEHGGSDVTVTVGSLSDGFYVADDGEGIDPHDQDAVFTSGFSTSETGSGFGLPIVSQIAMAHDWEIELCEGETGGACFRITGAGTTVNGEESQPE